MKFGRKIVVLENLRSAYNVGNVIRTAAFLGWEVWLVGYTPSPSQLQKWQPKVAKTSLGGENFVKLQEFANFAAALEKLRAENFIVVAGETVENAISLEDFRAEIFEKNQEKIGLAVVLGNEVTGVEDSTLGLVDAVVAIPGVGVKESLNVGQAAAVFCRELGKFF